jgi:hypothetical protein
VLLLLLGASACGSSLDEFTAGGPEPVPFADHVVESPAVAANGRGEMLLVWIEDEDVGGVVSYEDRLLYKAEFREGAWVDPTGPGDAINAGAPAPISEARVLLADDGDALVTWRQGEEGLVVHRRDGAWSAPFSVIPLESRAISALRPAINARGDAVVAWTGQAECDGQPCCVVFRSEYSSGTWTHPADRFDFISPGNRDLRNGSCSGDVDAAIAENGDAVVAWSQADPDAEQIFLSERRNGVWTDPSSLADNISPDGVYWGRVNVAMGGAGDAVVAWQQIYENEGVDFQFKPFMMSEHRAGVWRHPAGALDLLAPQATFYRTYGPPLIEMAANGDAIIAWGGGEGVFVSEHRGGAWVHPLGTESRINPGGPADVHELSVAIGASGDATVVWAQSVNALRRIFRSDYRGGAWTHPIDETDFLTPLETRAGSPVVALGSRGVIVWLEAAPFADDYSFTMLRRLWF